MKLTLVFAILQYLKRISFVIHKCQRTMNLPTNIVVLWLGSFLDNILFFCSTSENVDRIRKEKVHAYSISFNNFTG